MIYIAPTSITVDILTAFQVRHLSKVNSRIWLRAIDDSTLNIVLCIIILIIIINSNVDGSHPRKKEEVTYLMHPGASQAQRIKGSQDTHTQTRNETYENFA